MSGVNRVLLMGHLTRDPDLRYTRDGEAVCRLGLAVNRRYRTRDGEERNDVCFVDVEAFGPVAESCGRYGRKGNPLLVQGRLRRKHWKDRFGEQHSRLVVLAESQRLLSR